MTPSQRLKKQVKYLTYLLGLRPDEFGLVPDKEGFVKIKDLLKALHEEDGWGSFRQASINEILITLPNPPLEITNQRIRAKDRERIPQRVPPKNPPRLLYTCVRQKALAAVLEKGILPMGRGHVVLSSDKSMAQRIGRRIDASPTLLTVNVSAAMQQGCLFLQAGETLFLARSIPVGCFTSPPLPQEPRLSKTRKPAEPRERDKFPGSFFPSLTEEAETPDPKKLTRRQRREKDIAWKKSRKQTRRR